MIKIILSDFDGCIADLKYLHYSTLNKALTLIDPKFVISEEEHIKTFDGLSTKKKLNILHQTKNFPLNKIDEVNANKQKFTLEELKNFENLNYSIKDTIQQLKKEGYIFYVVSNAVRATIEAGLEKLGITDLVDKIYSNEDTKFQKPNPAIYLKCMAETGFLPQETLIIEDSKHGRESAVLSGAHVCDVDDSFDFSYQRIKDSIKKAENKTIPIRWSAKNNLNVLIPCAGMGSRMRAKYHLPKPLIDINGKTMIQTVVDNLNIDANYIFIVQKEHYDKYNLGSYLKLIVPDCQIYQTDGLTEGAACTTLLAKEAINNNQHLLVANSDQYIEWDSCDFLYKMLNSKKDGGILTFHRENDPKWSYVKTDENGLVQQVVEKKPISTQASIGIYYFNQGKDYVAAAEEMIAANDRVNNEFYLAPAYNYMINKGKQIITYDIEKMYGLGTIEDLEYFLTQKSII